MNGFKRTIHFFTLSMVEYNIVKHCGLCKTRFVVKKAQARRYLCTACEVKQSKQPRNYD